MNPIVHYGNKRRKSIGKPAVIHGLTLWQYP